MTGQDGMDPEIRRLVIEMMPQAQSEAWKVFSGAPHALDLDELKSLAYTGLMMAAARWPAYCAERGYDPGATNYFAAYALRRIRGSMLDWLRSQDWVTRSTRARAKALRDAGQDMGRSEAELAAQTRLTPKQIRDTLAGVAARPVSFDAEPHDVPDSGDVEGQVVVSSILARVVGALDGLDAETQVVLAFRFHQGLEFDQIAERLGTTAQRVAALHDAGVAEVHQAMLRAATLGGYHGHEARSLAQAGWIVLAGVPRLRRRGLRRGRRGRVGRRRARHHGPARPGAGVQPGAVGPVRREGEAR